MHEECQTARASAPDPRVVIVSGAAGSGKTTLGRALATALRLAPVDFDSVSEPLLDLIAPAVLGTHWLQGEHAGLIRTGRYAALARVARDILDAGQGVVLTAPFTAELTGGDAWRAFTDALGPVPIDVLYLDGNPQLLARRRAGRGAARDLSRHDVPPRPPVVPHTPIDAGMSTTQQVFRVMQALGIRNPVAASGPVFTESFDAVLFDLDGTLAESTAAVLRAWAALAGEYGFDEDEVQRNHGQPALALLTRLVAPEKVAQAELRAIELETTDVADVTPTPGALALLAALPPDRIAIVTSGRRPVAAGRLAAAGIAAPRIVVTRDDVVNGKPDPEPFLLAAERLGVRPERCLVVEDAPSGVLGAKRAGCTVLAVRGTSTDESLSQADAIVDALDRVAALVDGSTIRFVPVP